MDARNQLRLAIDRKGWTYAKLDRECGFADGYTRGLMRESQGGPTKAGMARMIIISEKLECPELVYLINPWKTVPHDQSAFRPFGQPSQSAKKWITFTRCVAGYMFCGEFLNWFNDEKLGQRGIGWSSQELDNFKYARRPRNNEVLDRHRMGGFEHFVIMREEVVQRLPRHGDQWLAETIHLLMYDLADTTRLIVVGPNKWAELNRLLSSETGIKRPCTVEVVDQSFAMYVEQCGGDKRASDQSAAVVPIASILTKMLSLVCTDRRQMIQRLKDIALAKKSSSL